MPRAFRRDGKAGDRHARHQIAVPPLPVVETSARSPRLRPLFHQRPTSRRRNFLAEQGQPGEEIAPRRHARLSLASICLQSTFVLLVSPTGANVVSGRQLWPTPPTSSLTNPPCSYATSARGAVEPTGATCAPAVL